jgi:hypothetical protein
MKGIQIFGVRLLLITLMFILTSVAHADESVGPKLTPRLKELVGEEMRQISTAMGGIWTGIVQGDHQTVAEQGMMVHNSFIMKRSLTKVDKKNLMAVVPPAFLKLDKKFHGLAKKLAEAATAHDSELELFYFGRMTGTCVACHTTYSRDRFPGFGERSVVDHNH